MWVKLGKRYGVYKVRYNQYWRFAMLNKTIEWRIYDWKPPGRFHNSGHINYKNRLELEKAWDRLKEYPEAFMAELVL